MAQWTLAEIRQKVRQVTGRYSPDDLSNSNLDEYINKYYQYTFPAEVKLDRFHSYYEFVTLANQQKYTLPSGYVAFEPPATIDNLLLDWYQNPADFENLNPEQVSRQTIGTGDGATTAFSGTAQQFPLIPGSTVISDGLEYFQDPSTQYTTSNISLVGTLGGTGTLNLSTGAVSVTFATAPVLGDSVQYSYIQFQAGRPTAVLMYNNQFKFYPIPDTSYRFKVQAYSNSLVLTSSGAESPTFDNATDTPLLDEWGPSIAYGTARDIFADYGENDAYAEVSVLYKQQLAYILRRTHENLLNTRATPHF